jgi:hypothetical protein
MRRGGALSRDVEMWGGRGKKGKEGKENNRVWVFVAVEALLPLLLLDRFD